MQKPTIAMAAHPKEQVKAMQLAKELELPFTEMDSDESKAYDYLLVQMPNYLGLQKVGEKKFNPFYIDFLSGKLRYRSERAGLKKELVARAMGVKPVENAMIIDATSGLGRDSFILASLGFTIFMIERSPILYALLTDAIERGKKALGEQSLFTRMQLQKANAIDLMPILPRADVIYLDPMFPTREKSASVKKEMVILQNLLGKDEDEERLFTIALTCAKRRVVVKRPRLAAPLGNKTPSFNLMGKSSRFDIYLVD